MASLLIIEHPKTGESYAVPAAVYRKQYADQGFRPVRHEDGSEYSYEPPQSKADKADAAAEKAKE